MAAENPPATYKLSFITSQPDAAESALEDFGATIWATEAAIPDSETAGTRSEVYFDTRPDMSGLALPQDAKPLLEALPQKDWVARSQEGGVTKH
ncbi:MAG: hypothetical protein GWP34_06230, partial [Alphaproteobacteria bacterium]|nr:hypothetical protein [Alphaproteobacteria bacterium]